METAPTKMAQRHNAEYYIMYNTHNRFTALLEYVRDHPGEQVPER